MLEETLDEVQPRSAKDDTLLRLRNLKLILRKTATKFYIILYK